MSEAYDTELASNSSQNLLYLLRLSEILFIKYQEKLTLAIFQQLSSKSKEVLHAEVARGQTGNPADSLHIVNCST